MKAPIPVKAKCTEPATPPRRVGSMPALLPDRVGNRNRPTATGSMRPAFAASATEAFANPSRGRKEFRRKI